MIMIEEPEKAMQKKTPIEISDLSELRDCINEIPDGTVYSIDLEVIELGQET